MPPRQLRHLDQRQRARRQRKDHHAHDDIAPEKTDHEIDGFFSLFPVGRANIATLTPALAARIP